MFSIRNYYQHIPDNTVVCPNAKPNYTKIDSTNLLLNVMNMMKLKRENPCIAIGNNEDALSNVIFHREKILLVIQLRHASELKIKRIMSETYCCFLSRKYYRNDPLSGY